MPAFRAERVRLTVDYTHQQTLATAGAQGWTVPGDNAGLAANLLWVAVQLDNGIRVEVRKCDLEIMPWIGLGWPMTG